MASTNDRNRLTILVCFSIKGTNLGIVHHLSFIRNTTIPFITNR